ncbi:MAG: tRNA adenosine(34) deaminase TadA [Pseudomonadota bacterium]
MTDEEYMQMALDCAHDASARDEVPIGAVLIDNQGNILAKNSNRTIEHSDPTAHAEILCIREACAAESAQRIPNTTLYVTLEPCTMCAAAIAFARIERLVIGALDEKGGGVYHGAQFFDQPTCHHKIEVSHGLLAKESSKLLKDFFKSKRTKKA